MKSHLLLSSLICVVLFGCGKAEIKSSGSPATERKINESSILGTWELRELQGGFRPRDAQVYYSPGNGNTWEFTDSTYKQSFEGNMVSEGPYTLTKDTALATGRLMDAVVLTTGDFTRQLYFEFNQDTLLLYDGQIAADGTIGKYVRNHDH